MFRATLSRAHSQLSWVNLAPGRQRYWIRNLEVVIGLICSLAQRNESGIITGDMFVNGKPLPAQFQRSCGYVQQQDVYSLGIIHLTLRFIWLKALSEKHYDSPRYFDSLVLL